MDSCKPAEVAAQSSSTLDKSPCSICMRPYTLTMSGHLHPPNHNTIATNTHGKLITAHLSHQLWVNKHLKTTGAGGGCVNNPSPDQIEESTTVSKINQSAKMSESLTSPCTLSASNFHVQPERFSVHGNHHVCTYDNNVRQGRCTVLDATPSDFLIESKQVILATKHLTIHFETSSKDSVSISGLEHNLQDDFILFIFPWRRRSMNALLVRHQQRLLTGLVFIIGSVHTD